MIALDPHLVLALDREGRPWRLIDGACTCRWGLNGRILSVTRATDGARRYRWLDLDEAVGLWNRTRRRLAPLFETGPDLDRDLHRIGSEEEPAGTAELGELLARTAARDGTALEAEAGRFAEIWTPVGILPPDQYLALLVQLTHGCAFNTCTFCGFYRDIPYRVKTPEQLRDHLQQVDGFMGRGAGLRRSLFLGDANALALPPATLIPLLEEVGAHYTGRPQFGTNMHSFLDAFTGAQRSEADYRRLRSLGLVRVCIGLESGHDPLLTWLGKPGRAADAAAAVRAMKAGGLAVSLTVLLGAGGRRFAADHERDTVALLSDLPLDGGDILYLSELVDLPEAPYVFQAEAEGIEPLTAAQIAGQRELFAAAPAPWRAGGPRRAVYDIREFSY